VRRAQLRRSRLLPRGHCLGRSRRRRPGASPAQPPPPLRTLCAHHTVQASSLLPLYVAADPGQGGAGAAACPAVAGPDADIDIFAGSQLSVLPSNRTLTFEHTYSWWGHARKLRVTANPNITVTKAHVSPWCRRARVVLLGPLTLHDLDAASFAKRGGSQPRPPSLQPRPCTQPRTAAAHCMRGILSGAAARRRQHACGGGRVTPACPASRRPPGRAGGAKARAFLRSLVRPAATCALPAGWLEMLTTGRQHIGLMGQGFQRLLDDEGKVLPLAEPSQQLLVRCQPPPPPARAALACLPPGQGLRRAPGAGVQACTRGRGPGVHTVGAWRGCDSSAWPAAVGRSTRGRSCRTGWVGLGTQMMGAPRPLAAVGAWPEAGACCCRTAWAPRCPCS